MPLMIHMTCRIEYCMCMYCGEETDWDKGCKDCHINTNRDCERHE